ncbi:MAG: LD-carboxypeptidase [Bacteroidales bacterium]|nr:LD-carboxypeptidase [Bacteroidales bacterium]MDD3907555.1 LD-carboxypeptidase [Bacteroidales bacterium]MDD4711943.1 LD-carboxypeptidase [Bacteroidales bacterium]
MITPPFLKKGDCVRLISPAGAINPNFVNGAEACLASWGLNVLRGENVTKQEGRFSGSITQRLSDLQEALDDADCNAIFCSRGGYGAVHLIDKIRLEGFREKPKWLIGYSDITMFHSLLQKEGYASIHGGMAKMLAAQMNQGQLKADSEPASMLHDILWGNLPEYTTLTHPLNRNGEGSGFLMGGNLSILYSLRGTPYDYIPDKSILFIEDIGEKPYAIDRMMHNLKFGGILKNLSGLIVGQFTDYEEDPLFGKTVYEIIADAVSEYSYPVCFDFPTGHTDQNLPLMTGSSVNLKVNADGAKLNYINKSTFSKESKQV